MNIDVAHVERMRVTLRGAVQGVGFRPFVFRRAHEFGLRGWVTNSAQGVIIEIEGTRGQLEEFTAILQTGKPPRAYIQSLESTFLDPVGYADFVIRESVGTGEKTAIILPDLATCPDCLREIFDPTNRRYLYPFTNCTNCGPRFTLIESLPYDRPNTSMKMFTMCPDCRREYDDPTDRRFHAQPNACPRCGPTVELWDGKAGILARQHAAMRAGVEIIRKGGILALKGVGGFHLIVDARNESAVRQLRQRKHREEKPLALMYPSIEMARGDCEISYLEQRLLQSPESPIVLLRRIPDVDSLIASSVAPGNPYLGVMLPYSPLHHILLNMLGYPIVATSGNLSDEPICIDQQEALARLSGIADCFLVHDRPIVRHVDDSVVRIMMNRELILRRSRGYAPLPVRVPAVRRNAFLAVGSHLKNAIAINVGSDAFVSQHIGDLDTKEAFGAFKAVVRDLQQLYEIRPDAVVCDLHPDYLSTRFARTLPITIHSVQHHYAHVASCMAENDLDGQVLGVSWDGTGYGPDGTVWGGEFLLTTERSFVRVGSFRPFRLPGGEAAIKEPRRTAVGVLYELFGDSLFDRPDLAPLRSFRESELRILRRMVHHGINTPVTSSAGRLFDAVASLIGLRQYVHFEGQAAMELEFALPRACTEELYSFDLVEGPMARTDSGEPLKQALNPDGPEFILCVDWRPMVQDVLHDLRDGETSARISMKFHNTLSEIILRVAGHIGEKRVVLSGGCFQNRYLSERTIRRLRAEGFRPYWHQRLPPNDGGIALGQIYATARKYSSKGRRVDTAMQPPHEPQVAGQMGEEAR